jgi:Sulfotransferase domain
MPFEKQSADVSAEVAQLKQRLSRFETEAGRLKGLAYQPRENDVAITTTPKAGTTWMQQICHQLRCGAVSDPNPMRFDEISQVVPWIELAADLEQDLEADQPPLEYADRFPRFFKTHCWYDHCPRFKRTIVVLRNPFDVVQSFYHFFDGWFFDPGAIDLETFAQEFWLARGVPDASKMQNASYFVHLVSWYRHRDDPGVLIVFFEDMKEDLRREVRRVAQFLSSDIQNFDQEAIIDHAVEYSSYAFMKENECKFDEKLSKLARNEPCGLPKNAGMTATKIRSGQASASDHSNGIMSENLEALINAKWEEVVLPATGCKHYSELRAQLRSVAGIANGSRREEEIGTKIHETARNMLLHGCH